MNSSVKPYFLEEVTGNTGILNLHKQAVGWSKFCNCSGKRVSHKKKTKKTQENYSTGNIAVTRLS